MRCNPYKLFLHDRKLIVSLLKDDFQFREHPLRAFSFRVAKYVRKKFDLRVFKYKKTADKVRLEKHEKSGRPLW